VDGILHAPLALSAFSLGDDLLVGHGNSFRYFILPARAAGAGARNIAMALSDLKAGRFDGAAVLVP
jgi:hypothetical protein